MLGRSEINRFWKRTRALRPVRDKRNFKTKFPSRDFPNSGVVGLRTATRTKGCRCVAMCEQVRDSLRVTSSGDHIPGRPARGHETTILTTSYPRRSVTTRKRRPEIGAAEKKVSAGLLPRLDDHVWAHVRLCDTEHTRTSGGQQLSSRTTRPHNMQDAFLTGQWRKE